MKLDIYYNPHMAHHVGHCTKFMEGMRAAGEKVTDRWIPGDAPVKDKGDVALFWSGKFPNVIAAYDKYLLMEGAVFSYRLGESLCCGWNGYHGGADYCTNPKDASRSKRPGLSLQPWRKNEDGYALIFGQVTGDFAARDVNLPAFYREAADWYRERGVEVRFRPHPHARDDEGPADIARDVRPLEETLSEARLTVSWSTTAASDAVAFGVPSVAICHESFAYPVTAHEYTLSPPTPDRKGWLNSLGQSEWTWNEVIHGDCWAKLRTGL